LIASKTAAIASKMTLTSGTLYTMTGLTSGLSWAAIGIVSAAKTGLDYRKYKNGEMSKDQFQKNA
jgi:hypothetical protein